MAFDEERSAPAVEFVHARTERYGGVAVVFRRLLRDHKPSAHAVAVRLSDVVLDRGAGGARTEPRAVLDGPGGRRRRGAARAVALADCAAGGRVFSSIGKVKFAAPSCSRWPCSGAHYSAPPREGRLDSTSPPPSTRARGRSRTCPAMLRDARDAVFAVGAMATALPAAFDNWRRGATPSCATLHG